MTKPKRIATPAEATKAKRDAFCADILADPEKYHRLWGDEARRLRPDMTDEQHENAWQQLVEQFGL